MMAPIPAITGSRERCGGQGVARTPVKQIPIALQLLGRTHEITHHSFLVSPLYHNQPDSSCHEPYKDFYIKVEG